MPFRAIADELRRQGFERDFKQCREKIKALKKHYKETVDSLRRSGVGVESEDDLEDVHIKFRWFAEMHGVMGRRAAVNPPALLDTSDLHRPRSSTADTAEEEDSLPMTLSVDMPGPSVANSVEQPGEGEGIVEQPQQPGANSVDQPGARESIEEQPGPLGTSSVEHPGARERTGEQPGPSGTSSVEQPGARERTGEQPGPSGANRVELSAPVGPRAKKRKLTKVEKMEKSNREMFDNFQATQEDTMRGFIELEKKRMEWQAEQERKDDARELHLMTFIKEIAELHMSSRFQLQISCS